MGLSIDVVTGAERNPQVTTEPLVSQLAIKMEPVMLNQVIHPWADAYSTVQSKYNKTFKGHMQPSPCIFHHSAYKTLFEYVMEDCPAVCGESWSCECLEAAIHQGNHASAQEPQAAKCFWEEALKKVKQGSA